MRLCLEGRKWPLPSPSVVVQFRAHGYFNPVGKAVIGDSPQGMWRLAKWAKNFIRAYGRGLTPAFKIQDPQSLGKVIETVDHKTEDF
ncbi:hypothetical protein PENANT_c008G09639 [Penicillium antarcticum]|uniref:Uncharacterized protein n=1 Tax=Penicillium antarcticum TaxID=416450 RepID=A0A1V6Q9X3_9EURO|nr:hypothetical protein PENANT_c008G09639 [Penicillium antarcticum]